MSHSVTVVYVADNQVALLNLKIALIGNSFVILNNKYIICFIL